MSCNHYASGQGYSGLFFDTKATATNGVSLNGMYSFMKHQKGMPCGEGLYGIFGSAFRGLDNYRNATPSAGKSYVASSATYDAAINWCNAQPITGTYADPFMQRVLQEHNVYDRVYGLWLNGSMFVPNPPTASQGHPSYNVGRLFFGSDSARTYNAHYNLQRAVTATLFDLYQHTNGPQKYYYVIHVTQMIVGEHVYKFPGGFISAIMDTGTSQISIPPLLKSRIGEMAASTGSNASFSLKIKTSDGGTIDLGDAAYLNANNMLDASWTEDTAFMLGFPLWLFNYVVTDVEAKTVSFVSQNNGDSCYLCPAGKYTDKSASSTCLLCPKGQSTQGHSGATACTRCSEGRYCAVPGCAQCSECSGTHYPRGSTNTHGSVECPACSLFSDHDACSYNIWTTLAVAISFLVLVTFVSIAIFRLKSNKNLQTNTTTSFIKYDL